MFSVPQTESISHKNYDKVESYVQPCFTFVNKMALTTAHSPLTSNIHYGIVAFVQG